MGVFAPFPWKRSPAELQLGTNPCLLLCAEHTEQLFCGFIFVSPRGWKLSEGAINAFKDVCAGFECYYCTQIQRVQQFPVMLEVQGRARVLKSMGRM